VNLAPVVVVALGASTAASGILVAAIWLVARNPLLDAKARYFLWFGSLVVIGALPIVGIGASIVGAHRSAVTANHWMPAVAQRDNAASAQAPADRTWKATPTTRDATSQQPVAAVAPTLETALSARERLASMNAVVALGLLAALALGALSGLIALLVGLTRLAAVKRRSSPLDQTLARELPWLTATPSARESYLRLSYEIETPVAIGFGRPVILIPTDLATQSGLHAIEDLVVHEHAHIERYDDYTNLIQRVVERVLWFNPFVWIVGRQLSLEREIAADDAVVARTANSKRYAEALWQLAREMRMPTHALVAPGALFTRKQITVRIEALMAPGRNRLHGLGPAGAAGALVVALLCVGLVAVAAPPLELPSAAAPRTVAWAPTRPSGAYDDSEALGALNDLAGFVDRRLSTMQGEVKSLGPQPSGARLDELTTTATLLGAKLETMESLAPRIGAPPAMRARITALQTEETRIGDTLKQRMDEYDARENAQRSAIAQTAKPAQVAPPVAPPAVPRSVPPTSVDARVNVPPVTVDAPSMKWAMKSAGSAFKQAMNASGVASTMVAQSGGAANRETTLTRSLIERCMGCDLSGRDLRNIDLHGLKITGADMTKTDLRGANLAGTEFAGTDLSGANLDGANLTGARFTGTDISNATFHNARMDGVQFTAISLRNSGIDPAGLRAILLRGCTGCDLSHMNLRGIDFRGIELTGVDLSHSDLTGANLSGVRLKGVDLDSASLDRANLRHAVLEGCSLAHASLDGAQLEGISLVGTSLSIGNDP
jgi:uncharacterized protein YjbI with pentapeptide repeats/beta-lactamase regulating signal transducer with metallopeptidase domain